MCYDVRHFNVTYVYTSKLDLNIFEYVFIHVYVINM